MCPSVCSGLLYHAAPFQSAAASQAYADPDDEHHYGQAGVRRKRAHGDITEGQHDVLREGGDNQHEHYLDGGGADDGAVAEADDHGAPTGNGIDYDVFARGNDDHHENYGSGGGGGGGGGLVDGDGVIEGASNDVKQEGNGQEEEENQARAQEEVRPIHGTMKVRDGDGRDGVAENIDHRRGEQDERRGHYYIAGHKERGSESGEGENNEERPHGEPEDGEDDEAEKERGWGEGGERGGADEAGEAISRAAPIEEEAVAMAGGGVGEARDGGVEVFAAANARADMPASAQEEEDGKGKEGLQQRLVKDEEDQQQQEQKQQDQEQQQRQQKRRQQREREDGARKARKERKRSGKEGRARSSSDGGGGDGGHGSDDRDGGRAVAATGTARRDGRVTRPGLDKGNVDTILSTITVKKDESDDDNADFARDGRREDKRRGEKKKVKKKDKKKGKRR